MISSTLVIEPGIKLKLPKAKTAEIQNSDKLIVTITSNNRVAINDEEVAIEELEEDLRAMLASRRDKYVVVRADKTVAHGLVVEVLDKAKLAGAENLALAAERKE